MEKHYLFVFIVDTETKNVFFMLKKSKTGKDSPELIKGYLPDNSNENAPIFPEKVMQLLESYGASNSCSETSLQLTENSVLNYRAEKVRIISVPLRVENIRKLEKEIEAINEVLNSYRLALFPENKAYEIFNIEYNLPLISDEPVVAALKNFRRAFRTVDYKPFAFFMNNSPIVVLMQSGPALSRSTILTHLFRTQRFLRPS